VAELRSVAMSLADTELAFLELQRGALLDCGITPHEAEVRLHVEHCPPRWAEGASRQLHGRKGNKLR